MTYKELGDWGEAYAAQRLEASGYTILERKFRCREGEIDLVAEDGVTLIFVEVKTRRILETGLGREAVTPFKRKKLRTAALRYLERRNQLSRPCRFDVAEITVKGDHIDWAYLPNAF